jgi:hypothetical protein
MTDTKPKHRCFRFRLRTLLLMLTAAGCLSALRTLWLDAEKSAEIQRLESELQNARAKNHDLRYQSVI